MLLAGVWRAAGDRPDDAAILTGDGQRISWARLAATVDAFARHLQAAGLKPGHRLAAWIDNPSVQICLWLAAMRLAAQPVLVPAAALAGAGQAADLAVVLPGGSGPARRRVEFGPHWSPDHANGGVALPPLPDGEAGLLLATSGSTGQPKLMCYLPGTAAARHRLALAMLGVPAGPVCQCLNVGSAAGWRYVYFALAGGLGLVLPDASPAATLVRMADASARMLCAAPGQLMDLCAAVEAGGRAPTLTSVLTVGTMCPPDLGARVERCLGAALTVNYGTTETSTVAQGQPRGAPGLVGATAPGAEVRADPATGLLRLRVPPEVRVGPYLNAEGPFDADGWMLTGDCGHLDGQGRLHLQGRADSAIVTGPVTVLPEVIEQAALVVPSVLAAAAFGVPRGDGWDAPWLAVVAGDPLSRQALARAIAGAVPGLPDVQVLRLSALPLTATGKPDRGALRLLAAGG